MNASKPVSVLVVGHRAERLARHLAVDGALEPIPMPVWISEPAPDRGSSTDCSGVGAVVARLSGSRKHDRALIGAVRAAFERIPLFVVVDSSEPDVVAEAIRAGGDGIFHSADIDGDLLVRALGVERRAMVLARSGAERLAEAWPSSSDLAISEREREVLSGLERELTNLQIAAELFVSRETVKTHVANLLRKFDAHDRREVVVRARRAGVI